MYNKRVPLMLCGQAEVEPPRRDPVSEMIELYVQSRVDEQTEKLEKRLKDKDSVISCLRAEDDAQRDHKTWYQFGIHAACEIISEGAEFEVAQKRYKVVERGNIHDHPWVVTVVGWDRRRKRWKKKTGAIGAVYLFRSWWQMVVDGKQP